MGAQENPLKRGFFGTHSETTACFACGIERRNMCKSADLHGESVPRQNPRDGGDFSRGRFLVFLKVERWGLLFIKNKKPKTCLWF